MLFQAHGRKGTAGPRGLCRGNRYSGSSRLHEQQSTPCRAESSWPLEHSQGHLPVVLASDDGRIVADFVWRGLFAPRKERLATQDKLKRLRMLEENAPCFLSQACIACSASRRARTCSQCPPLRYCTAPPPHTQCCARGCQGDARGQPLKKKKTLATNQGCEVQLALWRLSNQHPACLAGIHGSTTGNPRGKHLSHWQLGRLQFV